MDEIGKDEEQAEAENAAALSEPGDESGEKAHTDEDSPTEASQPMESAEDLQKSESQELAEAVDLESDDFQAVIEKVVPKVAVEISEEAEAARNEELQAARAKLPWYVVHTYSGFEQRVKLSLEERIRSNNLAARFGNVVVPEEKVVELVRGEKKTSTRKFFPGYILVQCDLDEETWHLVKSTPKVTGFVGDSVNPTPLSQGEVDSLLQQMEGGAQRPRPSVEFEQGDAVKVVDGPFADFNGTVDEVKPEKGKLRVLISIFGRNTPVELDFVQVEKV